MPLKQFNMNNLIDLDGGKAYQLINENLKRAITDIAERYDDDSTREVLVKIRLIPNYDDVNVQIEAKTKLPNERTKVYPMGRLGQTLHFQTESPTDPHQPGLPGVIQRPGTLEGDTDNEDEDTERGDT